MANSRINNNKLGNIAKHVNNLPGTFYSKSRARLTQATVLHKCKQRHGWIELHNFNKTSLLKYLKICMDLSVALSLHGNKITADKDLEKLLSLLNQKHYGA